MKEFAVSLDIVSDVLPLEELSRILEHPPDPGSHSHGDHRSAHLGEFRETIWSLYSKAPATAPLEEHLRSIRSRFPPERLLALTRSKTNGVKSVSVDIGVFVAADTFPQVILSREALQWIDDYKASVRIICYPVEEDDQEAGVDSKGDS